MAEELHVFPLPHPPSGLCVGELALIYDFTCVGFGEGRGLAKFQRSSVLLHAWGGSKTYPFFFVCDCFRSSSVSVMGMPFQEQEARAGMLLICFVSFVCLVRYRLTRLVLSWGQAGNTSCFSPRSQCAANKFITWHSWHWRICKGVISGTQAGDATFTNDYNLSWRLICRNVFALVSVKCKQSGYLFP